MTRSSVVGRLVDVLLTVKQLQHLQQTLSMHVLRLVAVDVKVSTNHHGASVTLYVTSCSNTADSCSKQLSHRLTAGPVNAQQQELSSDGNIPG